MKSLGWSLIQTDLHPYKWDKDRDIERDETM